MLDQVRAGRVAPEAAAAQKAAIALVTANRDAYFDLGAAESYDYAMVSGGTGFFVSEDGYLITAAHVVSAEKDEIRAKVISLFSKHAMMSFAARWQDKYLKVDKIDIRYYLGTGVVDAGERLVSTGARASVVNVDPTSTAHDMAIMKADVSGVPALTVSNREPALGNFVYAIGYPQRGYLEEAAPLNAIVKPGAARRDTAPIGLGRFRERRHDQRPESDSRGQ